VIKNFIFRLEGDEQNCRFQLGEDMAHRAYSTIQVWKEVFGGRIMSEYCGSLHIRIHRYQISTFGGFGKRCL
jgi:hypothetical protein